MVKFEWASTQFKKIISKHDRFSHKKTVTNQKTLKKMKKKIKRILIKAEGEKCCSLLLRKLNC
jgi:hypothetical protein